MGPLTLRRVRPADSEVPVLATAAVPLVPIAQEAARRPAHPPDVPALAAALARALDLRAVRWVRRRVRSAMRSRAPGTAWAQV